VGDGSSNSWSAALAIKTQLVNLQLFSDFGQLCGQCNLWRFASNKIKLAAVEPAMAIQSSA
jgi:hypothetical protein